MAARKNADMNGPIALDGECVRARLRTRENSRHLRAIAGLDLDIPDEFTALLAPATVFAAFGDPAVPVVGVDRTGEWFEADAPAMAVGEAIGDRCAFNRASSSGL